MSVPAATKVPLKIVGAPPNVCELARRNDETLRRLARLESISFAKTAPKGAALIVAGETTAALPLAGIIDMAAEQKRLAKELDKAEGDLKKMDAKLTNPQFMERAKEEAIEEAKSRKSELEVEIKRFSAALKRLSEVA